MEEKGGGGDKSTVSGLYGCKEEEAAKLMPFTVNIFLANFPPPVVASRLVPWKALYIYIVHHRGAPLTEKSELASLSGNPPTK